MTLTIKIDLDGEAFKDERDWKLRYILRSLTIGLYHGKVHPGDTGQLYDSRGEVCGEWKVSKQ